MPGSSSAGLGRLARRRFALTARTPREILVPLMTPVLFAGVIAPALASALGSFRPDVDYMSFMAIVTVGLLVPLNTMFSGIGVIVDRESGRPARAGDGANPPDARGAGQPDGGLAVTGCRWWC
jgi:hypothetical protein